jgi:hypothetical protein
MALCAEGLSAGRMKLYLDEQGSWFQDARSRKAAGFCVKSPYPAAFRLRAWANEFIVLNHWR